MQQYFGISKKDDNLYLNKDELNHIKNVMRMKENDEVIICYDGISYICSLNSDLLSGKIKDIFKEKELDYNFTVFVPLLNDEKMSFIFQHGTELGVTNFIVVEYEHCKYKLPKKDYEKKLVRWNRIIKEASEQSYRLNKPILTSIISPNELEINNVNTLQSLDKNDVNSIKNVNKNCSENDNNLKSTKSVNIMCSLDKTNVKHICKVLTTNNCNDRINLVFGPEGGLSKREEDMLEAIGFIKTSLGDTVLRTETVPLMVASIIKYLKESE